MSAPYQLTNSTVQIANRWHEILTTNKVLLGLSDVWFGDQTLIPRIPAICVEPGIKRRNLEGVPDMTQMEIDTIFYVYHSPVDTEKQQSRRESIQFAEDVEEYLHVNHTRLMDATGLIQLTIHSYCTQFDPGYMYKRNTLYHSVQMTWTNLTKVSLQRQL